MRGFVPVFQYIFLTATIIGTMGHLFIRSADAQSCCDFTISADPPSMSAAQGDLDYTIITVTADKSNASDIDLLTFELEWAGTVPDSTDISFDSSPIYSVPPGTTTAPKYLYFYTSDSSPVGTYTLLLTVRAYEAYIGIEQTSSGYNEVGSHQIRIPVEIRPYVPPDFTISAEPSSLTLIQGDSDSVSVTVESLETNEYTLDIDISTRWIGEDPEGVTVFPDQGVMDLQPGESDTLDIEIDTTSESSVGTYTLEITARTTYYDRSETEHTIIHEEEVGVTINPPFGFELSADPASIDVIQGSSSSSSVIISASPNNQDPMNIVLSTEWNLEPDGVDVGIEDEATSFVLNPGQTEQFQLTVEAAPDAMKGTYSLHIEAIGTSTTFRDEIIRQLDLPVRVKALPVDFVLSASPASLEIIKSEGTPRSESTITVTALQRNTEPIDVVLSQEWANSNAPRGIDVYLDPIRIDNLPPGQSANVQLRVTAFQTSDLGKFTLRINAAGTAEFADDTTMHQLDIPVAITLQEIPPEEFDFALSVDPSSLSILPGASDSARIAVSHLTGVSQPVNLSVQNVPPEVTYSLSINDQKPGFSSDLVINVSPNATAGSYTLTVLAEDAQGKARSIPLRLIILQEEKPSTGTVEIDVSPRIDSLILDGSSLSAKDLVAFRTWNIGEEHYLSAAPEVELGSGTKYIFDGWSDGVKSPERTVSVTTSSIVIVGNYKPQYLLTVTSPFGEVRGTGWYDSGTTADFAIGSLTIPAGFGLEQKFDGWAGPSASAVNQPCISGSDGRAGILSAEDTFFICMDKPQTLVAMWKEDASGRNTILGSTVGGIAAAGAGAFSYFKFLRPSQQTQVMRQETLKSEQDMGKGQKAQQKNFPMLRWHVYSSNRIQRKGRTHVDVLLENIGEVDVKNIKVTVTCPAGIEYDGGVTTIDLMLAHESKKLSFVLRHTEEEKGPFEVTLSLGYEFMTKFIRAGEAKKISLVAHDVNLGLVKPIKAVGDNSDYNAIKSWLLEKGFTVREIDVSSNTQLLEECASVIISLNDLAGSKEFAGHMDQYLRSGKRAIVYADEASRRIDDYRPISHLLGFASANIRLIETIQGFGIRISDSEHPITREFYAGNVFRIVSQKGAILDGDLAESASMLAEQMVKDVNQNVSIVPAITVTNDRDLVYINVPLAKNVRVLSHILERAILL